MPLAFAALELGEAERAWAGGGALAAEMIRVNHYGPDATPGVVHSALAGLGATLAEFGASVDLEGARRAAAAAWE